MHIYIWNLCAYFFRNKLIIFRSIYIDVYMSMKCMGEVHGRNKDRNTSRNE